VCQPSSAGVQLVCRADAGIVPVEIGGVCVPAKRELLSARFSPDGKQISIALNAATHTAAFSCSSLFAVADSTALGARAWCSASDRVLTVQLDGSATLLRGATLTLRENQTVLVDKLQSDVTFKGSVAVAACSECTLPIATVTGPQVRNCSSVLSEASNDKGRCHGIEHVSCLRTCGACYAAFLHTCVVTFSTSSLQ
jgi:hypothetical protein